MTDEPLLRVRGLSKHFPVRQGLRATGLVRAVDGLDFDVRPGETLGLVGESGCGKTTTGRMLVRLLEPTSGSIEFAGRDITHAGRRELRPLRQDLQIIFQDPYASLNPRHTVGRIVAMPLQVNGIKPPGGIKARVQELLELVGLNPEHYNRYPHEFSGGQRQRIGIARALALRPKLIVADEPVSALDVSIQAQVVNLLRDLQRELGLAFVFIAHDLAVVRHFCQRVAVMYLGRIVEIGDRADIYERPQHPYTRALLSAIPDVTKLGPAGRIRLTGDVPTPLDPPSGCRFRTRCWKAQDICATEEPALVPRDGGRQATACHFPEGEAGSTSPEGEAGSTSPEPAGAGLVADAAVIGAEPAGRGVEANVEPAGRGVEANVEEVPS
ncbi:peptide/nickel transport system ATP-binding protein [Micromonospora luteifusca]|uniref:Peptide/nickel transport system ATP-binding protein n=1 Tax=Micromonospora luteifusca TaxID=709860 RepID=A0ABS2LRE1_9ACTN|nr:dipeptide ABC transporter ATP-binding protein [Micromonospora luteifusca]MBM7490751.1 peptide/nickel transport system ATP-binding protein [Micromonospora luteifusca]